MHYLCAGRVHLLCALGAGPACSMWVDSGSNCWICEAWREVEFRYTPLSSGPAASRVSLQVSFDGWKSDVMDYCPPGDGDAPTMDHGQYTSGYFVLFRMVPPGTPFPPSRPFPPITSTTSP